MKYIALIGDVHGKMSALKDLTLKHQRTICTEIGFMKEHEYYLNNIYDTDNHKVLFGNHDYLPWVFAPHSLGHWDYDEDFNLFTIRGAWSIDFAHRTEGISWFAGEEVDYPTALEIYDNYCKIKPETVFSHDIPQSIKEEVFGYTNRTITGQLLQACMDAHKPKVWVHGHYHHSYSDIINDICFIGLDELEVYKHYKQEVHPEAIGELEKLGLKKIYNEEAYEKFLDDLGED